MKGSPVTHAPTPLKTWMTGFKGWEICARRQSRGLFISPSLSFLSLPLFPFQSSASPFLVLTNSFRMAICESHMPLTP